MKMCKYLSKFFVVFLALVMTVSNIPVSAATVTESSIVEEIRELGVEIPKEIMVSKNRDSILHRVNDRAKSGMLAAYNYTPLKKLHEELVTVYSRKLGSVTEKQLASYTLVNSTPYGSWSNSFYNYNCYAYVLNKTTWSLPGDFSGQELGIDFTISEVVDLIVDDLSVLGFTTYVTTTKPTSISGADLVMAVRIGDGDFHVMKAITPNTWRHKPGGYQPMTWNYSSPNYTIWDNEFVVNGFTFAPNVWYTSKIYYLVSFAQVTKRNES